MNKKLLAAAVAAAMVAPAAYADATLYGKIHTSIDSVDQTSGGTQAVDNWQVNSHSSRLGVKGSEDLGGGLKAIYQFEAQFNSDGGGSVTDSNGDTVPAVFTAMRNTFVGVAGGFGTFLVGRHDTPAKVAFYAAGNEILGDSIIDLNSGVTGVFSEVRTDNAIAYISPNFSGFTFAAAVVPGEQSGVSSTGAATTATVSAFGFSTTLTGLTTARDNSNDGLADSYSLGVMYAGGGLKASVGYEVLARPFNDAQLDDSKMWQLGASYTFGAFSVGAQYEDQDNIANVNNLDYKAWAVTGKASFGNNAVGLVYTDSEAKMSGAKVLDTDAWGIEAEHNFSKRTKVYAAYAQGDAKDDAGLKSEDDRFSLGMIHNF